MSSLISTLNTQNHWEADGVQTVWNFSFSDGYLSRSFVKAYTRSPAGVRTELTINDASFIGEFQLSIVPAVPDGHTLVIYRSTQKTAPLVDFEDGAFISEANLDTIARQGVHLAAESADFFGVTTEADLVELGQAAAASAAASAASAVTAGASQTAAAASATTASGFSASASSSATAASLSAANAAGAATTAVNAHKAELADETDASQGLGKIASFIGSLTYLGGLGKFLQYVFGRTAREIAVGVTPTNYAYYEGDPERYGALADDSTDDIAAFDKAALVAAAGSGGGQINLRSGKIYRLNSVWALPVTAIRLIIRFNGGIIRANHTGHGMDLTATNEVYGGHTIYDPHILGPNVSYPMSAAELAGTSTGAGIKIGSSSDTSNAAAGYNLTIYNPRVSGFAFGVYMRACILTKLYGGYIRFNQYGWFVDGGQCNANDWYGPSIRENRKTGVYSTGATGGSLTNATQNRVWGGIVESNIPYRGDNPAGYSGGYRTARDIGTDVGNGVVLLNSYDWTFHDTYFENQNVDGWFGNSSDGNCFLRTRHSNGGGGRVGGFNFVGAGVINNKMVGCTQISNNTTDVTVITDHADHARNQFLDTEGFNFLPANIVGMPFVRNNLPSPAGGGTPKGNDETPVYAYTTDASSGATRGNIDGIGTANGKLNVDGMEEITFGSVVAAAGTNTTIDAFVGGVNGATDGGRPGQRIVLIQNQSTRTVTIKASSLIIPQGGVDAVIPATAKRQIVFRFNARLEAIEEGRNF